MTAINLSSQDTKIEFRMENNSGGKFNVGTRIKKSGDPALSFENYPFTDLRKNQFNEWLSRTIELMPTIANTSALEYTDGVKLKSVVSYIATVSLPDYDIYPSVSYYGNFLPRIEAPISNPVAVIQGALYGTGSSPRSDVTINGIGDNNTNIVKDTVYENIQKTMRGKTTTHLTTPVPIGNNFVCNPTTACTSVQLSTDEEMIYVNADKVTLDNGTSDITWSKNKVLVINGGNLFVNSNLYTSDPATNKLGIVIIRNQNDEVGLAGNIYIGPNVTDIQAFVVAWGTVFSYDGSDTSSINSNNGEYSWIDENTMVETLKNQLVWKGGISSNNTIGGTDVDPTYYITGYNVLSKPNSDNLLRAKQYDLNYMRYFKEAVRYDEFGNPYDTSCEKYLTPEDLELILDGDNTTNVTNNGINCDGIDPAIDLAPDPIAIKSKEALDSENGQMYIKYAPPYSKSKIFGVEKRLTF